MRLSGVYQGGNIYCITYSTGHHGDDERELCNVAPFTTREAAQKHIDENMKLEDWVNLRVDPFSFSAVQSKDEVTYEELSCLDRVLERLRSRLANINS